MTHDRPVIWIRPAPGQGDRRADRAHQRDRRPQRPRRSGGPPGGGQGADLRPADPGGHRRPAQTGQEPAAQLAAQRAGGPRRRRRDHRAGHRRHLRRQPCARLVVSAGEGLEPADHRHPGGRHPPRSAAGAAGRGTRGAQGGGRRAQPAAQGRSGVHRHPRRRRSRPAAPVGDPGPAARRRRHADGQRHQPGVHRAGDAVHPPSPRDLPGRGHRGHQDRPVPVLAADRDRQHRAPAARRTGPAADPGVLAAAQSRHHAQRQGTQRGVQLPGDREVPLREGAVPGKRPGARPCGVRDPFGRRAFAAGGGFRTGRPERPRRSRASSPRTWSGASRRRRTRCNRPRCGSRSSTTASPT